MDYYDIVNMLNRANQIAHGSELVIDELPKSWKIFIETTEDGTETPKGFIILYTYEKIAHKPDCGSGKMAEVEMFTFPEYRGQGVCKKLLEKVLKYALENKVNLMADADMLAYKIYKKAGFKDTVEQRVWKHTC